MSCHRCRIRLLAAIFVALLPGAGVRAGLVEMRDGKTLYADLSITPQGIQARSDAGTRTIPFAEIRRADLVAKAPPAETLMPGLPPGWRWHDVGKPRFDGKLTFNNGKWQIQTSGWGFWGPAESGVFAWRQVDGDAQIIAHVSGNLAEDADCAAGVMIRQSPDAGSKFGGALVYPGGNVHFPRRPYTGWMDYSRPPNAPPLQWVRLAKSGTNLYAYRSSNGRTWELIGKSEAGWEGGSCIGIAAATQTNLRTGAAMLDSVQIIEGTPHLTWFPDSPYPPEGIVLTDGSMIGCKPLHSDLKKLTIRREKKEMDVPMASVAQILFHPAPAEMPRLFAGRHGILLVNLDLFEADYQGMWEPWVKMTSLIFGPKSFDATHDALAVYLADAPRPAGAWKIRLSDGSLFGLNDLHVEGSGIPVANSLLGKLTVPLDQIVEIQR